MFIRYGIEMPAGDDEARTFLKAISETQSDSEPEKTLDEILKQDLRKCWKDAEKPKPVSLATIDHLFSRDDPQQNIAGKTQRFIIFYLDWIKSTVQKTERMDKWQELKQELSNNVGGKSGSKKKNNQGGDTALFGNSHLYRILLGNAVQSAEEQESFIPNIFPGIEYDEKYDNAAYFVAFRQSTRPDRIIKSFIAILTPAENGLGFFSYLHLLKGSDNKIIKTTRGIVSHLVPATYFVGVTWRTGFRHPRNYEVIALERNMLNNLKSLIYGVTMGSAASNQPIIARIVLLRIGDRRSLGRKLTHCDIEPTEFKAEEIKSVIKGLMESVADGFKHIDTVERDSLPTDIKTGIQNVFSANNGSAPGGHTLQGALQTWGSDGTE